MALRHPWFSQTLKRKHPDDLLSPEGCSGFGGGGFGVVGTVCGSLDTNAYPIPQTPQSIEPFDLNGRTAKRVRKFESRNLERGFAELSIRPTLPAPLSPTHTLQQHVEQRQDTHVGGDGVWSGVAGPVGESPNVVCLDGPTLPLLRPSFIDEPPSPEMSDVQMSTSTWYELEKDSKCFPSCPLSPTPTARSPGT